MGVGRIDTTKVVEWDLDDGHKGKVVHIKYLEENPYDYTGTELNTLFNRANEGYISFDIYLEHELGVAIDICQEDPIWDKIDDICIRFGYGGDMDITVRDSRGAISIVSSTELELFTWYHFEIEFNCIYNTWNIKVSKGTSIFIDEDFNFYVRPSYLCQLYFSTYVMGNEYYVDNVHIILSDLI